MTRLQEKDIENIHLDLNDRDRRLRKAYKVSLADIAARSWKMDTAEFWRKTENFPVAVVPMTCGQGKISGFAATVASVIAHLGPTAFVPGHADTAGWADALSRGADGILAADDDYFLAVSPKTGRRVDNSLATGLGFVTALDAMCKGIAGKRVLILGCGPVGGYAALSVIRLGGEPVLCDIRPRRVSALAGFLEAWAHKMVQTFTDPELALVAYDLVVDATPAGGIIHKENVNRHLFVAAPGVPAGPTAAAAEALGPRLYHDVLQTGVAVMVAGLLADKGPADLFPFSRDPDPPWVKK